MLNGVPISAEAIEFKAEALNGSTVSIKGINLAMPNEYNDFWKYLREKLGYKLSAEWKPTLYRIRGKIFHVDDRFVF